MRRHVLPLIFGVSAVIVLAVLLGRLGRETAFPPLRIGILHSASGTMAASEQPVADATLLAIERLNAAGGLLGRQLEPIVRDGQSDPQVFAREAERLITEDGVAVIFGGWTSASRKQMLPVVERHGHLLFYPLQYEGLEQSPHIVYTGATPNQQIIPGVKWAADTLGRRFFLVGSDYVFPRTAHAIIGDLLDLLDAEVVGDEYLLLGSTEVAPVIEQIRRANPNVIVNTINGDTNTAFFEALQAAGLPRRVPVLSFSIGEAELQRMNPAAVEGHYAAWNYFQSLDIPENREFVAAVQARFGADHVVTDPMEAAYVGVQLWAMAVTDGGSAQVEAVRAALRDQSYPAPEGVVYLDPETQHTWKRVRIGQARADGQFDIVWDAGTTVRPMPFPIFRSRVGWETFLRDLQAGWDGAWANPSGQRLAAASSSR